MVNQWEEDFQVIKKGMDSVKTIEKIKEKDPEMVENINKLKNQILYNNKDNEI